MNEMVGVRTCYRSYNGTYYARTERKRMRKKTLVLRRKIHKEREGESGNAMDVFTHAGIRPIGCSLASYARMLILNI